MNKKIVIIGGYLASGKSTFARQLSKSINVPCFVKDTFKIALCNKISITNRSESRLFSAVTFDAMMYVAERFFETGSPIIIEGNFVPAGVKKTDEAGVMKQLIEKYGYTPLTFKFTGDTQILYKRFMEREKTVERGQANKIGADIPYDIFDQWCHEFDNFNVSGKTVQVDTTDFAGIDFDAYIEFVRQFMNQTQYCGIDKR